ncbi:hypothetical protein [Microbacterium sp. Se63.02b]|uniref:hypothetical protein n=1 Tax=Microbacterium sp. Se63.02b TaxID=2709304 RepID=UPI001604D74F|nr:hypothetical protein [Microbacterium sp. Se63.02b]QNA92351.1 hypothetical protein G4G29_08150 [Microbacterium sp. Se63.02b]
MSALTNDSGCMSRCRDSVTLQQGRPHEHDPQTVRRLLGQHAEETASPVLPCPLRVVDDEVDAGVEVFEDPADLGVGVMGIVQVAAKRERSSRAFRPDQERVHDALRQAEDRHRRSRARARRPVPATLPSRPRPSSCRIRWGR